MVAKFRLRERGPIPTTMLFEDKVILITGASSGIGAACAIRLAKEGAQLALVGRNEEKFAKVAEKMKEVGIETEPLIILADVSVDAERIVAETIEKYERIDILINNAGFGRQGTLETASMDDYDAVMGTNVRGLMQLTQLALPHLIATKGNILNVSSVCGIRQFKGFLTYCMSKSALDQFTKCTAIELAEQGVRVNSVNPGVIDTDFHYNSFKHTTEEEHTEFLDSYAKLHPMGRVGESDDVVHAIVFLINDRTAGFVTGICLPVDGGMTAKSPC